MDEAFIVKACAFRNALIEVSPFERKLQFHDFNIPLFTNIFPILLLLGFTRDIAGEALVLFDGRDAKPIWRHSGITPRNFSHKKLQRDRVKERN